MAVVGARGAGKSALITAFLGQEQEGEQEGWGRAGSTVRLVAGRRVRFLVLEVKDAREQEISGADAVLLCFSLASPLSLLPRPPPLSPPLVLVGCQANLRRDRLSTRGRSLVPARQALALSRQLGAVMYVETEASPGLSTSQTSATTAFEVAALACLGHFTLPPTSSVPLLGAQGRSGSVPQLCSEASTSCLSSTSRLSSTSQLSSTSHLSSTSRLSSTSSFCSTEFWEKFKSPLPGRRDKLLGLCRLGSLGNVSVRSLSSGRERPGLSVCTSPARRREERAASQERTVTIRCQRMTEERRCEEVDIAVPVAVYKNLRSVPEEREGRPGLGMGARLKTWLIRV